MMRSRRSISLVVILLVINYTLEVSAPPPPRPRTAESHAKRPSPAYDDYPPLLTVQGPPPGSTPYKGVNKDAPVPKVHTDETLIFEDDFNQFDLSVWEHEITLGGGGNWEFQYYTNNRTNSYVRDGILYLRPTLTSNRIGEHNVQDGFRMDMWGNSPANMCTGNQFYGCERMSAGSSGGNIINPIQSARVRTAQAVNVRYGRVEVRAMLPKGDWLWPAIWMLPRWNQYGDWPASGEIDIMESKGNAPSYDEGSNVFYSTLHWGPDWSQNLFNLTHAKCRKASGSFSDEFHTFGAYWDDKELYTYLDTEDNKVLHIKFDMPFYTRGGWKTFDNPWKNAPNSAPFDQDFFLILNVAVGGVSDFFPDNVGRKPWKDSDPHAVNAFYADKARWYPTWCTPAAPESCALKVDSVRVWRKPISKPLGADSNIGVQTSMNARAAAEAFEAAVASHNDALAAAATAAATAAHAGVNAGVNPLNVNAKGSTTGTKP